MNKTKDSIFKRFSLKSIMIFFGFLVFYNICRVIHFSLQKSLIQNSSNILCIIAGAFFIIETIKRKIIEERIAIGLFGLSFFLEGLFEFKISTLSIVLVLQIFAVCLLWVAYKKFKLEPPLAVFSKIGTPSGIILFGIISMSLVLGWFFLLLGESTNLSKSNAGLSDFVFIVGFLLILYYIFCCVGIFLRKNWARKSFLVFSVIGIICFVYLLFESIPDGLSIDESRLLLMMFLVFFSSFIYLMRPRVKSLFKK